MISGSCCNIPTRAGARPFQLRNAHLQSHPAKTLYLLFLNNSARFLHIKLYLQKESFRWRILEKSSTGAPVDIPSHLDAFARAYSQTSDAMMSFTHLQNSTSTMRTPISPCCSQVLSTGDVIAIVFGITTVLIGILGLLLATMRGSRKPQSR